MSQTILLRRSNVAGKVPTTTQLYVGELSVNTYDGKYYFKRSSDDSIQGIVTTNSLTTGSLSLNGNLDVTGSTYLVGNTEVTGSLSVDTSHITLGTNNKAFRGVTTSGNAIELIKLNTSDRLVIGNSTTLFSDLYLNSGTGNIYNRVSGSTIGVFSSTGLDVSGTGSFDYLSVSGDLVVDDITSDTGSFGYLDVSGDIVVTSTASFGYYSGQSSIVTLGTVTSGDVKAILPSGTVSSSAQLEPIFLEIEGDNVFSSSVQVNADTITNFDSNVKDKMNTDGVVSSSVQIDHDQTTNYISGQHFLQSEITEVGILNTGSISSGFGNINIGSSTFDTTGNVSTGELSSTIISASANIVTNGNILISTNNNGLIGRATSNGQIDLIKINSNNNVVVGSSAVPTTINGTLITFAGSQVVSGSLTISGSLVVLGETIEAQVTELSIEDKIITVASGSVNGAASDGAGIEVDRGSDTNVSMSWDNSNTRFAFNSGLSVGGDLNFADAGRDITIVDNSGAALEVKEGSNLYMRFVTTNGSEQIQLTKPASLSSTTVGGNFGQAGGTSSFAGNVSVTGSISSTTSISSSALLISDTVGTVSIKDTNSSGTTAYARVNLIDSTNTVIGQMGHSSGDGNLYITNNVASRNVVLQTAGTTALSIDANQQIGIGTLSPSASLHVVKASGGSGIVTALRLDSNSATDGDGTAIDFINTTDGSTQTSRIVSVREASGAYGSLQFFTRQATPSPALYKVMELNSSGVMELTGSMIVSSSGTIGIGLSPSAPLDIQTNSSGYAIRIQENFNTGAEYYQLGVNSFGGLEIYNETTLVAEWNDSNNLNLQGNDLLTTGMVSIGDANPSANLVVSSSNDTEIRLGVNGNDRTIFGFNKGGTRIWDFIANPDQDTSNRFVLRANGTSEVVSFNQAGSASFGTATPENGYRVSINGGLYVSSSVGGASVFKVEGTSGSLFEVVDSFDGVLMTVNDSSAVPIFIVSSSGAVGINKPNAQYELDVNGTGSFTGDLYVSGNLSVIGDITLDDISSDTGSFGQVHATDWVGVGTTSTTSHGSEKLNVYRTLGDGNPIMTLQAGDGGASYLQIANSNTGTTNADGFFIGIESDESAMLYNRENTNMRFWTNGTERMRIVSSSGALLIGTTSTTSHGAELLHISRATSASSVRLLALTSTDSGGSYLQFANSTTTTAAGKGFEIGIDSSENAVLYNRSATTLQFGTNDTERMRIASGSYAIGIGTTDVENWDSGYGAIEFGKSAIMASNSTSNMVLYSNVYFDGVEKYKSASTLTSKFQINAGVFAWSTAPIGSADAAVSWSERMRLTNSGSLLIGTSTATTTATEKLLVQTSGGAYNIVANASDSDSAYIQFTNSTTGNASTDGFRVGIDANEVAQLFNREATAMVFATNSTERMRIASGSYAIGIGTTDIENWDSSHSGIEFYQSAILAQRTAQGLFLLSNAYYDGTNRYKVTGEAARFGVGRSSTGGFEFDVAASGAGDTPITWVNAVKITNAGSLLVNTGSVFIGDTANANMTVGLTINQAGNTDEILALKESNNVSHGLTSQAETDTWFHIKQANANLGGAVLDAFVEDNASAPIGLLLRSYGGQADTTKSTAARALVEVYASEHDGANNLSSITANGNVFAVRANVGGSTTLLIVDEDGDTWQTGGATFQNNVQVTGSINATGNISGAIISASVFQGNGGQLTGITASAAPAGSDGQIQYNNGGVAGGTTNLFYDDANHYVGIGTTTPTATLTVSGSTNITGSGVKLFRPEQSTQPAFELDIDNWDAGASWATGKVSFFGEHDGTAVKMFNVEKDGSAVFTIERDGGTTVTGSLGVSGSIVSTGGVQIPQGQKYIVDNSAHYLHRASGGSTQVELHATAPLWLTTATTDDILFRPNATQVMKVATTGAQVTGSLDVNGSLSATTKSFKIDNPVDGGKLVYGVIESNCHSVAVSGKLTSEVLPLPREWSWLVDPETISVQLTPFGGPVLHWVDKIKDNKVYVLSETDKVNCFFTVTAVRRDVPKLEVNQ